MASSDDPRIMNLYRRMELLERRVGDAERDLRALWKFTGIGEGQEEDRREPVAVPYEAMEHAEVSVPPPTPPKPAVRTDPAVTVPGARVPERRVPAPPPPLPVMPMGVTLDHSPVAKSAVPEEARRGFEPVMAPPPPRREAIANRLPAAAERVVGEAPEDGEARPTWEARIGKNWAGWVGAIVMFLGVGFFLKYAWEHEWINPSPLARVISTVLFGIGLGGIGEWLYRKPMRGLAGVLYGAGVAVAMAGIFAGHVYFDPPVLGAFAAGMLVVVAGAAGVMLALRADLVVVAILALLGAYLSPAILGGEGDQSAMLLSYLAGLAAVGWTLCLVRPRWTALRWFVWVASFAWYGFWWLNAGERGGHHALAIGWLCVVYGGFLAETFVAMQREFRDAPGAAAALGTPVANREAGAAALSLVNTAATALAFYGIYMTKQPVAGALMLGLAGVQALVATATWSRQLRYSAILQGAALATVAVPLMLSEFVITLAWLVMAVCLGLLRRRLDLRWARGWAVALLVLSLGRLVTLDLFNPALRGALVSIGSEPVTRWLLMAWGTALAWHVVGWLGSRRLTGTDRIGTALAAVGTLVFLAATTAIWGGGAALTLAGILWLVAIVGLQEQGGQRVGHATHAWALLVALVIKWLVVDGLGVTLEAWDRPARDPHWPVANLVCLAGVMLGGLAAWLSAQTKAYRDFAISLIWVLAFALANFETCRLVNYVGAAWDEPTLTTVKQVALCGVWTSAAMFMAAFTRRPELRWVRQVAVGLFVLAMVRVLLFASDSSMREAVGHAGEHTLSRWLLMCWGMAVGAHVLAWLVAERRDEPDPLAAPVAGLGTMAFMASAVGTWGFTPATTLAGVAWLAIVAALVGRGRRLGYAQHAWALAVALAVNWLVVDGMATTMLAWSDPTRDPTLPVANLTAPCGVALAALFAWLGRSTPGRGNGSDARVFAATCAGLLLFGLLNFELCRAVNHFAAGQPVRELVMAKQVGLSILWALVALAAIVAGFGRNVTAVRYAGLGLLGVTLVKILLVDMAGVETIWRILSFMAVGGLLLCVSFVYYKYMETKAAHA